MGTDIECYRQLCECSILEYYNNMWDNYYNNIWDNDFNR